MVSEDVETAKQYDERYGTEGLYWSSRPSAACYEILRLMPPDRPVRVLDIGCGEGRNALFLARNGYQVDAFDISRKGVDKAARLADEIGVPIKVYRANLVEAKLTEEYDVLFSTGVLQCIPVELRSEIFANFKQFTRPDGLHVLSVFVRKPFIAPAPDGDANSSPWRSGELFAHYHDWKIESCTEEIFDCMSSGVPHQHAVNRLIARKVEV